MITLVAGDALATVHPAEGGRVGRLRVGERDLLHYDADRGDLLWGSYPMAPWAGRLGYGRFRFDGVEYLLDTTLAPHAIHGTTPRSSWTLERADTDSCAMYVALDWPLGGVASQRVSLTPDGLHCTLTVTAADRALPAVVGWHPCFVTPPVAGMSFTRMYQRGDDGLPTGELVDPPAHPWDDCFVGPTGPLTLEWADVTVTVASDADHWVVFDMFDDLLGVEPQSGPPDAFNLGCATRLEPGDSLTRHMAITWCRRE